MTRCGTSYLMLAIVFNTAIILMTNFLCVDGIDKEDEVPNPFNNAHSLQTPNDVSYRASQPNCNNKLKVNNELMQNQVVSNSQSYVAAVNIPIKDTIPTRQSKCRVPLNQAPLVENITLSRDPDEVKLPIFSNSTMYLNYDYYDEDGDAERGTQIHWYCDNGTGWFFVSEYDKKTEIKSSSLIKGHRWYVLIRPRDGNKFGDLKSSSIITVVNTPPSVVKAWISPNVLEANYTPTDEEDPDFNTTSILTVYWIEYDVDDDFIAATHIIWECSEDGEIYNEVPELQNIRQVLPSYTSKFQKWRAKIRIFDGEEWSPEKITKRAKIGNSLPKILDFAFIDHKYTFFLLEDEGIKISYTFFDADGDSNLSQIRWFMNGSYLPEFDGRTVIYANETQPSEVWYFEIHPFDGEDYGQSVTSRTVTIESCPTILNFGYTPLHDYEGHYQIWIETNDIRNPVTEVTFSLLSESFLAEWNGTHWVRDYDFDLSYLNTTLLVTGTVTSTVRTFNEEISTISVLSVSIEDHAPPRVNNVVSYWNEDNPNNITFVAEIEELGSEVEEVIIYYYFNPIEGKVSNKLATETISNNNFPHYEPRVLSLMQFDDLDIEWKSAIMKQRNTTHWEALVDYNPELETKIRVKLFVVDSSGNFNDNAYPRELEPLEVLQFREATTITTLDQETFRMILIAIIIAFISVLFFSAVAIRKWRNVEFVGFDKDSVLANIANISEVKVASSLDQHTLGILVSFFDQKRGPRPIITQPNLLRDNYELLIELADQSFAVLRFVDNFEDVATAAFEFILGRGIRINSLSYGFSLYRPDARGGAENLTMNILIQQDVFPIVNTFIQEITLKVKKIHRMLDQSVEKNKTLEEISDLRKYISYIVLSYEDLNGTTELII
ncbi:MAG: hypothetical protein ACFFCQ_02750 [Promethearchaeota archaeon]